MLLLIDNFDSFTFNIVQAIQKLGIEVVVKRNHMLTLSEYQELNPEYLVIGPGPGTPSDCGISQTLIRASMGKIPILGICLGMQLIATMFGGDVVQSPLGPMHGKTSPIYHNNSGVFNNIPQGFLATRYHSLSVDRVNFPNNLEITAKTEEGEVMGLAHKHYPIEGVQFHPESVISEQGMHLFENYLYYSMTDHVSKFDFQTRRRPEFKPDAVGAETVQLE